MVKNKLFLSIFILFLFLGCMKRTNPLDPNANPYIIVPKEVTGFSGISLSSTIVKLTWVKNSGVDGYYIYRSMSIDGDYIRVDKDMLNNENYQEFLDENPAFSPHTFYWYKISAYKIYNNKKLEGYRSDPIYVYIQ